MLSRARTNGEKVAPAEPAARNGSWVREELRTVAAEEGRAQGSARNEAASLQRRLTPAQRSAVLQQVYRGEGDEGLGFLARFRERLDRAGLSVGAVTVRFRGLSVQGRHLVVEEPPPGSSKEGWRRRGGLGGLCGNNHRTVHLWSIIEGASGVLHPGRLTLLLGAPGSGRSTLMQALAGRLQRGRGLEVTAEELSYNGQPLSAFAPQRMAAYVPEEDWHFPDMTVRETVAFAARVQGAGQLKDLARQLEGRESRVGARPDAAAASVAAALAAAPGRDALVADILLRTLGLEGCADTPVGSALYRGISGGERKRLTTAEMLAGFAKVIFADEVSTGLDSATTHSLVRALSRLAAHLRVTALVALLQPPPETVELFDEVMVLSHGRIAFHGPREALLPFLEGFGFTRPPPHVGVADWVQELTSLTDQGRHWPKERGPHRFISASQMADAWRGSEAGRAAAAELSAPFDPAGADCAPLVTKRYGTSLLEQLRACLRRGLWLQRGLKGLNIGRVLNVIIIGFCVGTLFLNQDSGLPPNPTAADVQDALRSANNILGVAFFSLMYVLADGYADSAVFVSTLPIWWKQKSAGMYRAVAYALPPLLLRLPWRFAEAWIWTLMVYFLVGFTTSPRILVWWCILFTLGVFSFTLFIASACLMRSVGTASALSSFFILVLIGTCGFTLNAHDIPPGWKAAYWANPMQYSMTALAQNELLGPAWSDAVPYAGGQTAGQLALQTRGIPTSHPTLYALLAILAGGLACSALNFAVAVALLAWLGPPAAPVVLSAEAWERQALGRGGPGAVAEPDQAHRRVAALAAASMKALGLGAADLEAGGSSGGGEAEAAKGSSKAVQRALPFHPMTLAFSGLTYSVPYPKGADRSPDAASAPGPHAGQLVLLRDVSGAFRTGVLHALMGATGAGKTTLLDCLACRKTGGVLTGDIRVNGHPRMAATFARVIGYCEQTDIHSAFTTVHEALQFSARLRLPASVPPAAAEALVQETIDLIELGPQRDSLVGSGGGGAGNGGGLSREQRKRLTIAVELVANPSVVFLDEPTTSLDARGAAHVMRVVQRAAHTGRTIVATIHQPSLDIFSSFHHLLLLRRGGQVIFNGGTDALVAYFQGLSGVPLLPPDINPADWVLEITSPEAERAGGRDFAALWAASELAREAAAEVQRLSQPAPGEAPLRLSDLRSAGCARQTWELLKRNWWEFTRVFGNHQVRLVVVLVLALVYSTLFIHRGSVANVDSFSGVLNVAGMMYSSAIFVAAPFCFMVQQPVFERRLVFYRERAAQAYGALPFWLAESLAEVPWLVLIAALYCVITYWSVGFISTAGKFFFFYLMILLGMATFTFLGVLLVHLTPSPDTASAFAGLFFSLFNVFCGFMLPKPSIPRGWIWMYYLDPASYLIYGMVVNQLGDLDQPIRLPSGEERSVAWVVEWYFGYSRGFQWATVGILLGFLLALRGAALAALRWLNFQRR